MNLDGIKKVFEQFDVEEKEQYKKIMHGADLPPCNSDIITCKFLEKDKLMIEELIPKIDNLLENESFQKWIIQLEKNKAKEELKAIINKLETTNYNEEEKQNAVRFYTPQIKENMDKVKNLNFKKFVSSCKGLFNSLTDIYINDLEFYRENYTSVCVAKILFEDYKKDKARKNRFKIPKNNKLEKLYQDNDIDLNSIDAQYNKYKLLTIDSNFEISISNIPKVYDKRLSTYLYVNEIQEDFLQLLKNLQEQKYISDLALRPEYTDVYKDLQDLIYALEEKEFGKIFSFENLESPTITKLYSTDEYSNKLWIIIDEENITFEETLEDFEVYDDFIVTQVIHLQYKNDGSFFLYKVLDTYFVNKDLIQEYFEDVLKK